MAFVLLSWIILSTIVFSFSIFEASNYCKEGLLQVGSSSFFILEEPGPMNAIAEFNI
jgi:hypothetical protein